jgi:hypothetical protein
MVAVRSAPRPGYVETARDASNNDAGCDHSYYGYGIDAKVSRATVVL